MTAALEGGEWSAARPGRTLLPGKTRYPLYRRQISASSWFFCNNEEERTSFQPSCNVAMVINIREHNMELTGQLSETAKMYIIG